MLAVEKRITSPLLVSTLLCSTCQHASKARHEGRARDKRCLPSLQVPKSNEKVAEIDEHIGCAMSGLTADARTLVDHGRNATQVCYPVISASARRAPESSSSGISCNRLPVAFEVWNNEQLGFRKPRVLCSHSNTASPTTSPCRWSRARSRSAIWPCNLARTTRKAAWYGAMDSRALLNDPSRRSYHGRFGHCVS